jgi:hypothetical protein
MRKTTATRLTAQIAALLLVSIAPWIARATADRDAPPTSSARVAIEFLADGRCTVTAEGEGFHSAMTYLPHATADGAGEFRCAVPPVPSDRPVELTVTLAAGARPSGEGLPALAWVQRDGRWIGTASLGTAPEVVVVEDWSGRTAVRRRWMRRAAGTAAVIAVAALGIFVARALAARLAGM